MIETDYRPLSESERRILEKLLENPFPGRDELVAQLDGLTARQIDVEGSLALKVTSAVVAPVVCRVPVDGQCADSDTVPELGPYIRVLLHVIDGRMHELEIYKDDGSAITTPPNAGNMDVIVY